MRSAGVQLFGDYTTNNVGKYLAIVLDKRVISSPVINSPITGGSGVISGRFTVPEANALAVQLKYGSLPIPLRIETTTNIGPTLGQDSIDRSLLAGAIGVAIVAFFMIAYYRLPGVLAVIALTIYGFIVFSIYKVGIPGLFPYVTLTLPGIAGFVLSLGVAVDGNILIFERMKEELREGRTLGLAMEAGFDRAWPSIRDSNASTFITSVRFPPSNVYIPSLTRTSDFLNPSSFAIFSAVLSARSRGACTVVPHRRAGAVCGAG